MQSVDDDKRLVETRGQGRGDICCSLRIFAEISSADDRHNMPSTTLLPRYDMDSIDNEQTATRDQGLR
jgi:hypothetical protein